MDVIVSRSGGLAGIRLVWKVQVDDRPDRDDWVLLLRGIPWDDVPPQPPEPDRYTYRIQCPPHDATLAERQLTGPWRVLVDRVRESTEPRPAGPSRPRTR